MPAVLKAERFLKATLLKFRGKCAVSGADVVLDTNAAILLLKDKEKTHSLDQIKPGGVRYISVITQIELLGYPNITEEDESPRCGFLA
jgi:hypothetical protein